MNKLINWFKQSNRYKHSIVGILITAIYITLLGILFNDTTITSKISICSISIFSAFTHMCAVEYKDIQYGSKFDWNDILAGIIPPTVITILTFITTYFVYELL